MLQIKKLSDGIYHINEGNPNRSMLYRYNVLVKDNDTGSDNICTVSGKDTVILTAKREVKISVEKRNGYFHIEIPMSEKERFFGMGDATRDAVEMRGMKIDIDIKNVVGYGPMPLFLSTDGWAFLLNCTYRSIFNYGKDKEGVITIEVLGGEIDYYLFVGESLKELLSKITDVTGKPMMLPKFAYGLTFVENEQTDARSLLWDIRTLRDRNIPCDTMGLEPTWMEKHYDFSVNKSWNKEKFYLPHWKEDNQSDHFSFFFAMRKMGMQLSLWLCEDYDLFYKEDSEYAAEKELFTPDAVILDENFASERRMDTITKKNEPWFEHLKKFVDNGAAAFKLDGSAQIIKHPDRLWGEKYTDDEVHNIYPVILAKQMAEGFREYTDRRLLLYTAGAYTGTQQYAATWAGDTGGGPRTVASLLNYAMCGHSNTSCDIDIDPMGVHYGFLLPWSQYFCWASWKYPWFMDDETEETIRFYSNLRSSLVPYLYTMAHKAYETGIPVMRPLPLMYEDTTKFDQTNNAYMLGDNFYVGVFDMNLKLPEGKWIDYFTGDAYEGDITYEIPEGKGGALFIKEGSVIVTMKPQKYVLEKQHDYVIKVYPGADSSFALFEDDGFTYDYEKGIYAETLIETKNSTGNGFDLIINPRTGGFNGRPDNGHNIWKNSIPEIKGMQPERDMTVEIFGKKPSAITVNGVDVPFDYNCGTVSFVARVSDRESALNYRITY